MLSLEQSAAEYAEAEQTLRVIRQRVAASGGGEAEELAVAERLCREARARLIDATHRETR